MKILWISHTSTLFGAERCLIEFLKATNTEHENYLVLPSQEGKLGEFAGPYIKGKEIIETDWWASPQKPTLKRFLIKYYYIIRSVLILKRYIKRIKPDVIISNTFVTIHGAVAAKLAGVPHFYYIHEYVEEDHNFSFDFGAKWSCSLANSLTKTFFVNATGVKLKFEKYLPLKKLKLLYYIIDIPKDIPILEKFKHKLELLLPAGRVEASKGQMDAIRAIALLKDRNYDIHLTIFGINDNEYSTNLKQFVADNAIGIYVTLLQFSENPFSYFKHADICLVTSRMEAFGRTTVEAMKLGKPVIGTRSGETQYLIDEGKTGLLYNYNDPQELADKIGFCYNNSGEVQKMKVNAALYANTTFNSSVFMENIDPILKVGLK